MGVSSRAKVISAIYKKGDENGFPNDRPTLIIFRCNNISTSKY